MAQDVKTYYHNLASCKTVLKEGKIINFVNHLYATAIYKEQVELDELVAEGLWLRPATEDEVSGTAAGVTFTELVKERLEEDLRKKIMAELAAGGTLNTDTGANNAAEQLKPISTAQLLGAADSNAGTVSAAPAVAAPAATKK